MDLKKEWYKFYDRNVPFEIEHQENTIIHLIEGSAKKHPGKTILVSLGKHMSYKSLIKNVDRMASGLIKLGIKKGDRICLLLPNLIQFPVTHLAILKTGAISVPVNPLLTSFEIRKIIRLCEPKILIVLTDCYHKVKDLRKEGLADIIIHTGATEYSSLIIRILSKLKSNKKSQEIADSAVLSLRKLINRSKQVTAFPEVYPGDPAVLLVTGGKNGKLKLAELTHRNIASNAAQIMHWASGSLKKNDSLLGIIPLFHSFGITLCLHFCLISSVRLVLIPRFNVRKVLNSIHRFRINIFTGVPEMFSSLLEYPRFNKANLSALRICLSGGDELSTDLQLQFEQATGIRIIDSYGLTEASPAAVSNPFNGIIKPGSIGIPLPSTLAMIIDPETGIPLPPGVTGELVIKGPQVMKGYWKNPEETSGIISNNWLHTGDLACMDDDSYIFLKGRLKNLIIHCGFNIFPVEVEEVLKIHPGVEQVLVTGKKEKRHGEVVIAYIVPANGPTFKEKELRDHCRKFLAGYKVPCHFEFVSKLPDNHEAELIETGDNSGCMLSKQIMK